MSYGMLIDTTMCVGCGQCSEACQTQNKLEVKKYDRLNAKAWTVLTEKEGVNVRRQCFHCNEPACASVCPVGALVKNAEGPVSYDVDKCMGCRYCMMACPYQVPTYEWTSVNPAVKKCIMCKERVVAGKPTACSEACPTGATLFGKRDELIAEAYKRIAAEPKKYVNAIFGEKEAGGTAVLYLASVEFAKLGFPTNLPEHGLPHLTWEAISEIPAIVTAGVPFLGGIWWICNRRDQVAEDEGRLPAFTKHNADDREDA